MTPTQIWGFGILLVIAFLTWEVSNNKDIQQPVKPDQMTKWDYLNLITPYLLMALAIVLLCDPWRH